MAKKPYIYGKSPNPHNWHEAVDALKSLEKTKTDKTKDKK